MSKPTCVTCYFFVPVYIPKEGETKEEAGLRSQKVEQYAGFCYRYPPFMESDDGTAWYHPAVDAENWCGEHKMEVDHG